ncbi:type I CRISPR-associated protein Cas7 [Arcicella aquatica]|uniref:Type I CRISPR-associated protein Cas7 n=1 Tax=Arcicella aquatica TaxID=217141 RepID=A0ABU5QJJ7_9BACT|nr:type I CRISPR-associated protein Cas7 [Arcicella aquatica]MEA5256864.1 type I CRISPR-associated protein Cas7 [Arcicella aquatica]
MSTTFNNRVFGCVVIKSINSNYNADFTHQPRTLPDGTVYATDKALKYSVRNYLRKAFGNENIFYFKTLSTEMQPRTLDETYESIFGKYTEIKGKDAESQLRKVVLKNLLTCLDVRLFGGTYAGKTNLSIHGPVQITHGIDQYKLGQIYSEQIMSPFRNPGEKNADSTMTTLGSQSKLSEGHYVHGFSVNPHNITDHVKISDGTALQSTDIDKLKAGLSRGVTFYDSAAKSGSENEMMLWVQLKEGSMIVLPSFVELIKIKADKSIDLSAIAEILGRNHIAEHIEKIELVYDKTATTIVGIPAGAIITDINQ